MWLEDINTVSRNFRRIAGIFSIPYHSYDKRWYIHLTELSGGAKQNPSIGEYHVTP
jgi:hypothetical protein